jgi:hypothetical protein
MTDHAAKVRDALNAADFEDPWLADEARAALAALLTERDAAVKERDEYDRRITTLTVKLRESHKLSARRQSEWSAAETTLTRYRNALEQIARSSTELGSPHSRFECQRIARAALDGPNKTGPATAVTVSAPADASLAVPKQAAAGASSALDGPKEEET